MKKTLILIAALLALGASTNVKADLYGNQRVWGFRTDWLQARDFGAKPIKPGDTKIEVKTAPNAVLFVYKKEGENWKIYDEAIQGAPSRDTNSGVVGTSEIGRKTRFAVANGAGLATFYLNGTASPGDQYKLRLSIDGFFLAGGEWTVGESMPKDEEEKYDAEIKKIEDDLERQDQENDALDALKKQQEEEARKTWYQRLGDGIEDQWANFKDWARSR